MDTIISRKNKIVQYLRRLAVDKAFRCQSNEFLCQGSKLLNEALLSGAEIGTVLYSGDKPALSSGITAYQVKKDIIDYISPMNNPPEVIFSCSLPKSAGFFNDGAVIVLENIQDPGNVGTIMRTAAAFGAVGIVLIGACADPYGPKAVRASMGAVFRLPVFETNVSGLITYVKENNFTLYTASLRDNAVDIRDVELPKRCAVAVGNEGHGLSEELLAAGILSIKIPITETCESLNAAAAAAIILWEMSGRGRRGYG